MLSFAHNEKRDFLLFLMMIYISAIMLAYGVQLTLFYGILGMFWGIYGFFRLAYVSQNSQNPLPSYLSLPAKLLFGLGKIQEEKRQASFERLEKVDFIFWCLGAFSFVAWALYCSYFPAEISIVRKVIMQQEVLLNVPLQASGRTDGIIKTLSLYGMMGTIIFTAVSFAPSEKEIKSALYGLFPVFVIGIIWAFIFMPIANPVLFPSMALPKGGGIGVADIIAILSPETTATSKTGMMGRMLESGWVGGYGLYALFVIPVIYLLKAIIIDRRVVIPMMGLLALLLTLMLDLFWISYPVITGLIFIGLSIFALSWGLSGLSSNILTKEQK